MRFAALVTAIALLAVTPAVAMGAGPHMSEADFIKAVQCTAYDNLAHFEREIPGAARNRALLAAEARAQADGAARQARRAAARIAREGARANEPQEIEALRQARAVACGETQMADAAQPRRRVEL